MPRTKFNVSASKAKEPPKKLETLAERVFIKTEKQKAAISLMVDKMYTLLDGGSRSGKSFIFIYAMVVRALKCPNSRHLILRLRFNHVKTSIWYDTLPKVLSLCFKTVKVKWNKTDWFVEFENGSQIWIGGLDEKERTEKILGTEYSTILFNEANQLEYTSVTKALTRLAQNVGLELKAYFDCNPPLKRHWLYKLFFAHVDPVTEEKLARPEIYGRLQMNPAHNLNNLSDSYITDVLDNMSARERQRFKEGIWLDEREDALWTSADIERNRVPIERKPKDFVKIGVGVDPAVSTNANSDETGIIVGGKTKDGHIYIWEDRSGKYKSNIWAKISIACYEANGGDRIIAERNQGGDLVERNIAVEDEFVPVKTIHATRGKEKRAEPVSALSEENKDTFHIVGVLQELEDEMVSWVPGESEWSPNRLDAMVWLSHWLLGTAGQYGTW